MYLARSRIEWPALGKEVEAVDGTQKRLAEGTVAEAFDALYRRYFEHVAAYVSQLAGDAEPACYESER